MSISVSIRCEIPVSSRPSIISISIDRYVSSSSASYFALHSLKASEDSLIRGGLTKAQATILHPIGNAARYVFLHEAAMSTWSDMPNYHLLFPILTVLALVRTWYTTLLAALLKDYTRLSTNALLDLESNRDWTDPAVTLYICFTHRHWYLLLIKDTIIIVICTALELVISCYYYWGGRLLLVKANIPPSYLMFFIFSTACS